jgi:hypothetical protein
MNLLVKCMMEPKDLKRGDYLGLKKFMLVGKDYVKIFVFYKITSVRINKYGSIIVRCAQQNNGFIRDCIFKPNELLEKGEIQLLSNKDYIISNITNVDDLN